MGRGRFITFEGGDGSGKSTHIAHLAKRLEAHKILVTITREPGGSLGAEQIRGLLVTGQLARWDGMTEALLFFAARRNHVETLIKPELAKGIWVLCDRFADSTKVYQGIGQGVGEDKIDTLYNLSLGNFKPDLTIVLDVPIEVGLTRSGQRLERDGSDEDRFERMGKNFHTQLRKGFLKIARDNPKRCRVVDATKSEDEVADAIWCEVTKRFKIT